MNKRDSTPYFINHCHIDPSSTLSEYPLLDSYTAFRRCRAVTKVFVPDSVELNGYYDESLKIPWWSAVECNMAIRDLNPVVLTYVYGCWRHVINIEELDGTDIPSLMESKGYILTSDLGYMSQENLDHYYKVNKLLFG